VVDRHQVARLDMKSGFKRLGPTILSLRQSTTLHAQVVGIDASERGMLGPMNCKLWFPATLRGGQRDVQSEAGTIREDRLPVLEASDISLDSALAHGPRAHRNPLDASTTASPIEERPSPTRFSSRFAGVLVLLIGLVGVPLPSAGQQEALLGLGLPDAEDEAPTRSIAPTSSVTEDRALKKRLSEIYAQVEGLEAVTVEVHAGVVQISGEVFSDAARDQALRIANQLQGVAEVQDEIVESRDLERRLRPVLSDLRERFLDFLAGAPLFGVALLLFALFLVAGRLASYWDAPYRRITRNPFASDVARQAVYAFFFSWDSFPRSISSTRPPSSQRLRASPAWPVSPSASPFTIWLRTISPASC
jgi:hypothetical protein